MPSGRLGAILQSPRFFVGGVFLLAAALKLYSLDEVIANYNKFRSVPDHYEPFVAFTVIATEIVLGISLILLRSTRWPLSFSLCLLLVFTLVTGYEVNIVNNDAVACNCFGKLQFAKILSNDYYNLVARNVFLSLLLIIAYIGMIVRTHSKRTSACEA